MRLKQYETFEYYENKEDWQTEKIFVDLDAVCAVKEYKGLKNDPVVQVFIPGECFLVEMSLEDFCKDWKGGIKWKTN